MSNTEMVPLDSLVDSDRGISYGIVQPGKHCENGIPMIRVNNITDGKVERNDLMMIDPLIEASYSRTRLQGGEILLTLVGSIGKLAIVPNDMTNYNVARAIAVIPVKKHNVMWIKYYLESPIVQQHFANELNTTVQATLNLKTVKSTLVWMPSVIIQEKIVEIISGIDNKRDSNIAQIQIYDRLLQAIYRECFLNSKTNAEWDHSNVYEHIYEVRQKNREKFDYPVLSVVKGGEFRASEDVFTKQVYSEDTSNYKIVRRNQVAYNPARANIGSIAMLREYDAGLVSPIYVVFNMKESITNTYFYYYMNEPMFVERIRHHAIGTTRQNFPFEAFKMFELIVPPMDMQLKFGEVAKPIEKKIATLRKENVVLSEIKDTLLPRFMSGDLQLEVDDNG